MDSRTEILNGYPTLLSQRVAFGTQPNSTLAVVGTLQIFRVSASVWSVVINLGGDSNKRLYQARTAEWFKT